MRRHHTVEGCCTYADGLSHDVGCSLVEMCTQFTPRVHSTHSHSHTHLHEHHVHARETRINYCVIRALTQLTELMTNVASNGNWVRVWERQQWQDYQSQNEYVRIQLVDFCLVVFVITDVCPLVTIVFFTFWRLSWVNYLIVLISSIRETNRLITVLVATRILLITNRQTITVQNIWKFYKM